MDIEPNIRPVPLRHRVDSIEEFNGVPTSIYPASTHRDDEGIVSIGGVRLTDLVADHDTPVFVMDEAEFRERCRAMGRAFGEPARVHYASKALITTTVCRWVKEEGLSLDVASEGELRVALAADFPPERITVHGNNKSEQLLALCVEEGVELVVIDSLIEIERLSRTASERGVTQDVLIRVTPGVHVDTHEFIATSHEDQKFGFSLASGRASEAAHACLNAPGITLRGLHCHVGSQVFEADGFVLAAERLLGLWEELRHEETTTPEQADQLNILDLGGGYGIAYTVDQEQLDVPTVAHDLLTKVRLAAVMHDVPTPEVNVEPGRAIAGPSMVTVYRVGTIKDVDTSDRTVRRYVSVDGGMSDNIRPALYSAEYDCRVVNRELSGELRPCRVVGSHCESGDVLINDVMLPEDLEPGDLLMIGATGAYCYSMVSRYNMLLRPPIVIARDGETRVMVRRETLEDVLALDNPDA